MSTYTPVNKPQKGWVVQPFFTYPSKKSRKNAKLLLPPREAIQGQSFIFNFTSSSAPE
jgi:hypothetical protein